MAISIDALAVNNIVASDNGLDISDVVAISNIVAIERYHSYR